MENTGSIFDGLSSVLLDEKGFLKLANECGIKIEPKRLALYRRTGCIDPVSSIDSQEQFSPFQLYTLCLLEEAIKRNLSRLTDDQLFSFEKLAEHNRDWIKARNEGINPIFSFVHRLEPIYFNHFTATDYFYDLLGIQPRMGNIPNTDWSRKLREEKIASREMEKLNLNEQELERWLEKIGWIAHEVDPCEKWYHLLQSLRKDDYQKIRQLKGYAALAQHLYRFEIILRGALEDITSKKYLNPHDIRDLRGGSWRIARLPGEEDPILCAVCKKNEVEMKSLDSRLQSEFLCAACLQEYIEDLLDTPSDPTKGTYNSDPAKKAKAENVASRASWKCKGCEKILLKSLHDSLGVDNSQSGLLIFEVPYGKLRLYKKCKCGELNQRDIQVGFDIS